MYPTSTAWQSAEQPSPLSVLPSSHALFEVRMPFPHTPAYSHGFPSVGQLQLASIWQSLLQPSLFWVLPSSHCSLRWMMPSPQVPPLGRSMAPSPVGLASNFTSTVPGPTLPPPPPGPGPGPLPPSPLTTVALLQAAAVASTAARSAARPDAEPEASGRKDRCGVMSCTLDCRVTVRHDLRTDAYPRQYSGAWGWRRRTRGGRFFPRLAACGGRRAIARGASGPDAALESAAGRGALRSHEFAWLLRHGNTATPTLNPGQRWTGETGCERGPRESVLVRRRSKAGACSLVDSSRRL